MTKAFKKYMNPYTLGWKMGTLFLLFMLAMFTGIMVREGSFSIIPLLLFGGMLLISLMPMMRGQKFFQSLESSTIINQVEADFAGAIPFVKGTVRLGKTYIFSKHSGRLVKYTDITKVYQAIRRTNFMESSRSLNYLDPNGVEQTLCQLRLRGKSDSEVKDIIRMIQMKNPGVKIGY